MAPHTLQQKHARVPNALNSNLGHFSTGYKTMFNRMDSWSSWYVDMMQKQRSRTKHTRKETRQNER